MNPRPPRIETGGAGGDLREAFATLRRLMEARMGKAGNREYVNTRDEALERIQEVLELVVAEILKAGEPLPKDVAVVPGGRII